MASTKAPLTSREAELAHSLRALRLRQLVLWRSTLRLELRLRRLNAKLLAMREEILRLMAAGSLDAAAWHKAGREARRTRAGQGSSLPPAGTGRGAAQVPHVRTGARASADGTMLGAKSQIGWES